MTILRELPDLVFAAFAVDDSKSDSTLAALSFDDEDSDQLETPKKKSCNRRAKKDSASVAAETLTCKLVKVPRSPTDRDSKVSIFALLDARGRLWLSVDAVPWLVDYVRAQKESGGVAPVVDEASVVAETTRIYWNFRDDCWTARARCVDGTWMQTTRGIKRRQNHEQLNFPEAKQAVYVSLQSWVADVEAGTFLPDVVIADLDE